MPTPWDKDEFEKHSRAIQERRRAIRKRNAPEAEIDALFREQRDWEEKFFASMKYGKAVGAFEGASYEPSGLYRPQADCIMFTRDGSGSAACVSGPSADHRPLRPVTDSASHTQL